MYFFSYDFEFYLIVFAKCLNDFLNSLNIQQQKREKSPFTKPKKTKFPLISPLKKVKN